MAGTVRLKADTTGSCLKGAVVSGISPDQHWAVMSVRLKVTPPEIV
jgi:hypothetical protein